MIARTAPHAILREALSSEDSARFAVMIRIPVESKNSNDGALQPVGRLPVRPRGHSTIERRRSIQGSGRRLEAGRTRSRVLAYQPVEELRLTEHRPISPYRTSILSSGSLLGRLQPAGSTPVVSSDLNEIDSLLSTSTSSTDCYLELSHRRRAGRPSLSSPAAVARLSFRVNSLRRVRKLWPAPAGERQDRRSPRCIQSTVPSSIASFVRLDLDDPGAPSLTANG